jgi:RHH-type proline utilization regulon transcriptional repressor/proline dehydrogenase/delta 1-pyrroline-5-carboxylate dehydrogenase
MDWERSVNILVERVRPIFRRAKELGTFCNIDMEHYALKGITLDVFKALMADPEFSEGPDCGVVIQAYLKDSATDLEALLAFSRKMKRPITLRLVKGAYWDYEVITAHQHGWEVPVFEDKARTDENYERLTDTLLSRKSPAKVAIGSHNIRSIAHAMARAESEGIGRLDIEFQMIYGMAEPIKGALVQMGYRVRDYVPIGELIPGMSYLVRRLLENTSNESFLRSSFVDSASPEKLLESPSEQISSVESLKRIALPQSDWGGNLPLMDFRHKATQVPFNSALDRFALEGLGSEIPVIVAGETRTKRAQYLTLYPGDARTVVARTALAQPEDVLESIERARNAVPAWSSRSPRERADVLRVAAGLMVKRRLQLAALQVYEVGKSWQEADADVCEAVDFLRYYAFEMERLSRGIKLGDHPGEYNFMGYRSRGVGAVIAPWNFPLAIVAGMASAALVAGNGVLLKPAEQSSGSAFALYELLIQAGVPQDVLHFLPGIGHEVGPLMVDHPEIDFIAFTGSREVGLDIIKRAAIVHPGQRNVKQVIAEMGGKNAVIVDDDADLDEAVLGVSHSAFGFQGQKCSACSRVIAVGSVYDAFVERFVESTKSLTIGVPTAPGNLVNAVIDKTAFDRINGTISKTANEIELAIRREVPEEGYFVGPTVFVDASPDHAICQEEIFGPVVAITRASSFEEALAMANNTQYALTGGVFSRSPGNIEHARREFDVGNLYINRGITGALVGRQAFGGYAMSGVGSKAGGPDYLLQFLHPRVITENTMRRGFSPETV